MNSTVFSRITTIQGTGGKKFPIPHDTGFLRNGMLFAALPAFLRKNVPEGIPIEFYASSDGSTVLTAAISIFKVLGADSLSKYPIYASEKFPHLLDRAKSGFVSCYPGIEDRKPQNSLDREWSTFAVDEAKLQESSWKDFLEAEPVKGEELEKYGNQKTFWQKLLPKIFKEEHFLFKLKPEVNEQIQANIHYIDEPVDLVSSVSSSLCPTHEAGKPRLIIMQSFLYLLTAAERKELYANLQKLPAGSIVIFGEVESTGNDITSSHPYFYNPSGWRSKRTKLGFSQPKGLPNTWVKNAQ